MSEGGVKGMKGSETTQNGFLLFPLLASPTNRVPWDFITHPNPIHAICSQVLPVETKPGEKCLSGGGTGVESVKEFSRGCMRWCLFPNNYALAASAVQWKSNLV